MPQNKRKRTGDMGSLNSQKSTENKEIVCKLYVANSLLHIVPYQVIYQFKT